MVMEVQVSTCSTGVTYVIPHVQWYNENNDTMMPHVREGLLITVNINR